MIERIKLNDVASYNGQPQELHFTEDVGIIYGLNGTGKSTIARYLSAIRHSDFANCEVKFTVGTDPDIFVYDNNFIDRVFYQKDEIEGIFTIGEIDTTSEKIIERSTSRIRDISSEIVDREHKIENLDISLKEEEDEVHSNVWRIVKDFKGGILDFCLDKYRSNKAKFYNALEKVEYESDLDYGFKDLEDEIEEIEGEDIERKNNVDFLSFDLQEHENDIIFRQQIIASGSSYLSEVINKLDISDWVLEGQEIMESESYNGLVEEVCPFCQQELPKGFQEELTNVFDITHQEKTNKISQLLSEYENAIEIIKEKLDEAQYEKSILQNETNFEVKRTKFVGLLESNLNKIKEKDDTPSQRIELKDTSTLIEEINQEIKKANEIIDEFNSKIDNRDDIYKAVKEKFWKLTRCKSESFIEPYQKRRKRIIKNRTIHEEYVEKARAINENLRDFIKERREKVTNIGQSVEWINEISTSLGLIGFEIVETKDETNTYKLIRDNDSEEESVFNSLSEGEKTLITFLYFLELINGTTKSDEPVNRENRIVIIDDPISSLSHNYIYEVASQIQYNIIREGFGQVIILTHNLFFLHEVLHQKRYKDSYDLYRLVKNENSVVKEMNERDIQNDYEGYWQSYKDIKESGNYLLAPIVMRNILENYFSFIKKRGDLSNCIYDLEQEYREYKPFLRFINKETHSNRNTIQDMGEIDPSRFFEIFKNIFEKTGYQEHYYTMSGEEPEGS